MAANLGRLHAFGHRSLPLTRHFKLRLRRVWHLALAASVLATLMAAAAHLGNWFGLADAERSAYDFGLTAWTPAPHRSPDIVIVALDEPSFEAIAQNPGYRENYGSWPFARSLWAQVVSNLADEGVRAVVFDLAFPQGSSDPANDLNFANAVAQARVPVYFGFTSSGAGRALPVAAAQNRLPPRAPVGELAPDRVVPLAEIAEALAFPVRFESLAAAQLAPADRFDAQGKLVRRAQLLPDAPMAALLPVAAGFGMLATEADPDGKLRRTRFAYSDGANTYVTLAVAVAADLLRAERLELAPGRLSLGSRQLAIDADGSAGDDYGGPFQQRFQTVSLVHLLDKALPAGTFTGKVVLVGGFAVGTSDMKATPFEREVPGVVKHATELDSLLNGRFLTRAPFWLSVALAFALAFFSVALILVVRSPLLEVGWPVALYLGLPFATGAVLVGAKLQLLTVMPTAAAALGCLGAAAFNHLFAGRDRELLRETFGRYMERELVEQLVEGRDLRTLEAQNLDLTAFFSDIRGFSTFSERFRDDPRTLAMVMNRYLQTVTEVLVANGGCIDKYVGDAVIALFGAPIRYPDHAERACRAALEVQQAVGKLCEEFAAKGLPDLATRIGVNTGLMMVGNFGSDQLVDYTAFGDEMNLAARLEGANKAYGTRVLIGPRTYEQVRARFHAREVDRVRVAGRSEPVAIFELLGPVDAPPSPRSEAMQAYARGLSHYRAARFSEALAELARVQELVPGDGPALALGARCEKFLERPPSPFEPVSNLEK
jgi:adenylate cyclase